MEFVRKNLEAAPNTVRQWYKDIADLTGILDNYQAILTRMHEPAVKLKEKKDDFQGMGLSFSKEIENKIITPYRKEEGLRIYQGGAIDPFKTRVKDTASDLNAIHIKQQLILLELILSSNLEEYKRKKQVLSDALAEQNAQLRYMSILIGDSPSIQSTVSSLTQMISELTGHEQALVEYLTILYGLEKELSSAAEKLQTANRGLSGKEDEKVLVEMGSQMLKMLGYRVVPSTSPLEALELFRSTPEKFDLVISDMTMPKMTGDKLAAHLLKIKADLPIILCTGFSNRLSDNRISELGVKALVFRPLAQKDLALHVRKALTG